MANLGILNGAEFYLYDVEVYDKILYSKINFKPSQVSSITSKGYKILSNGFYGINRTELIKQFIKYLAKMDINVDSDSFLLNEVTDKRIKKEGTYVNDPHIFSSSASQYDAQSTNKNTTNTNAKKEVKVAKPILDIDIINKDNMYKTTLNLKDYNLGDGTKTLYAFTQPQLKDKIESYFKSFKLDYDVNLNLVKPTQDVGKVLIDVTLNKDKVIGEVDLSHVNLPNIKAEATTKQGLLDAIINQLKSQNLTGKLNWGKIVDNTKKVGDKKMANMTKSGLKSFATKLSKAIKTIGMNQDEIEARVFSMVPNATYSDPTLAGNKVDLSFILPWDVSSSITKTDIKAIAKEKNLPLWDINVTKAEPWLYITDEIGDGIRIEVVVDVHFNNNSDDTEDYYSLDLITMDIPLVANDEPEVAPQQANTFKSKLKPKNAEVMESMGKFYDDGYSSTVGSDAGLDVVMKGDRVDVTIRLFPSASQDDVRLQELNQMKDTLRAIENLPTTAIKASTSLTDDVVKCNVSIKQFDAFIFKLLSRIQGGLKSYYALHLFNKDALDIYGTKPLSKKPLPTTTMNSIVVRDEFIKQVLHGMDCTLINISEDDFRADVKAFHQVKVNKIKNLDSVNLDFPNQKMCIATIAVINSDDIGIINANMSEEHQVKFNGKIGTIRMKVNKDDIKSIVDIVALIKDIRNADAALKDNVLGKGIQNSINYDVEVYDKRLSGILNINGSTKTFYGPDRDDLISQFIKHLNGQGIKANSGSFILNNVTDKRIKKSVPYANDPTILPNAQDVKVPNTGVEDMGKVTPKAPASSSPVVNDIEPTDNGIDPKRKTEINYKTSAVKDPDHKAQLDRMKAYVKKIADVVDADNDFTLRFLEEPKEFTKYKLPTVGVGLFYYGDKSIAELEQSPLYKKVYRGRGLSILRKFFKTTDQNGEKCLLVLFVDAQYAKQTKAKLIKESFEQNTKISINGKQYTIKAIYEDKFAIETIVGAMYIDMDSELIDLTINEE